MVHCARLGDPAHRSAEFRRWDPGFGPASAKLLFDLPPSSATQKPLAVSSPPRRWATGAPPDTKERRSTMTPSILHAIRSVPPIRTWSPGAQTVLAVVLCFAALAAASVAAATAGATAGAA